MKRPQENEFPCKNQSFNDGNEYYLIKNMRYMVALGDYIDYLENKLERLNKLYSESQTNLMVSNAANRNLSDIINELTERGK